MAGVAGPSNHNLRNHTSTIGPSEPTVPCLEPGCIRRFYNRTGRSNHIRSAHPHFVQDPQQLEQAIATTSNHFVPSQASSGNDLSSSRSDSTVPSNPRIESRGSGDDSDESIDSLDDNVNVDIVFDVGHEGDDHRSSRSQTLMREPSAARSNDLACDPVIPHINRTCHPIINGQFHVLTVIHIYFIFRSNL
jgi:hypothetical protein